MKSHRTWILIADGGRARIVARRPDADGLAVVAGHTFDAGLAKSSDLSSERPGRSHESHGATRHAIEAKTDPHDAMEQAFLEGLVTKLGAALAGKEFDRLVIVAPPRALGIIRPALTDQLKAAIVAEVGKDLTKTPDHEIAGHLPPEALR